LIGLSPLPTAHPSRFQPTPVRTSTRCYPRFILAMGRSLGFGSAPLNSFAPLRLAFASAPGPKPLTSPRRTTPRIIMQKARSHPAQDRSPVPGLLPLVGMQFQVLFHPASAVLFTFPSRYSFTIGHRLVFSLGRRSSQIQPGFLVSRPTQVRRHAPTPTFRLQGSHLLRLSFPTRFG
jgi:hypothetical protein